MKDTSRTINNKMTEKNNIIKIIWKVYKKI